MGCNIETPEEMWRKTKTHFIIIIAVSLMLSLLHFGFLPWRTGAGTGLFFFCFACAVCFLRSYWHRLLFDRTGTGDALVGMLLMIGLSLVSLIAALKIVCCHP